MALKFERPRLGSAARFESGASDGDTGGSTVPNSEGEVHGTSSCFALRRGHGATSGIHLRSRRETGGCRSTHPSPDFFQTLGLL